jgi:hypothetical protein
MEYVPSRLICHNYLRVKAQILLTCAMLPVNIFFLFSTRMGREGEGIALALGMHMHDALACFCARSCSLIIYLESLRNIS